MLPWGVALLLSACRAQPREDISASAASPSASLGTADVGAELEVATLELDNPSAFARPESPLYLAYHDLGLDPSALDGRTLQLRASDEALVAQSIDRDGDRQWSRAAVR